MDLVRLREVRSLCLVVALVLAASCAHAPPGSTPEGARVEPTAAERCGNPTGLAAGGAHACAVCDSGRAVCWGSNDFGQLGDGSREGRGAPVLVEELTDALALVAGLRHTCALLRDGSVSCWGGGDDEPRKVAGVSGVRSLAAGGDRSCAVDEFGKVSCWRVGGDDAGRPLTVPQVEGATRVAVGAAHACAVLGTGAVVCWGDNARGQLGEGTTDPRPSPVGVLGLHDAEDLAAGAEHTCARQRSGQVTCWGAGMRGQLGRGALDGRTGAPQQVGGLFDAVDLAAGGQRTCAARATGALVCWGEREQGPLAETVSELRPGAVVGLAGVARVAVGETHLCALSRDGSVACAGQSAAGQLGNGRPLAHPGPVRVRGFGPPSPYPQGFTFVESRPTPAPLPSLVQAQDLAVGGCQTCAVGQGGRLDCIDTGVFRTESGAVRAATQAPVTVLEGVTQVSLGGCRGCAVTSEGQVRCWGVGGRAGLGDGAPGDTALPVRAGELSAVSQVSVSGHACAVTSGGELWCWGDNVAGQISPALAAEARALPTQVPPPAKARWAEVSTGTDFTCARTEAGEVFCWGTDSFGQLGGLPPKPSAMSGPSPVRVEGVERALTLDAGHAHACAVLASGQVRCWGWNASGQLGANGTAQPRGPVVVAGVEGALAVSAGERHTCAVIQGGTALCWGENAQGELGDGTRTPRLAPVPILGLTDVAELSAGDGRTCARHGSGQVSCWGRE